VENKNPDNNAVGVVFQPILEAANCALKEIQERTADVQSQYDSIKREIDGCKDLIRNANHTLRRQQESLQSEYSAQFDDFLKNAQDKIESHQAKLTELIGKATIGPISKRYEDKVRTERLSCKWFLVSFYVALVLALIAGVIVVLYSWKHLPVSVAFWEALKTVLIRFAACTPIYIPLFWIIAHFNRWAVQKNRLAEEYEHKKLVVETYVGLADQVEALLGKGVKTAPDLVATQLAKTIDVVCFDACASLDKVRIQTPVGEIAKDASQALYSVSEVVKEKAT